MCGVHGRCVCGGVGCMGSVWGVRGASGVCGERCVQAAAGSAAHAMFCRTVLGLCVETLWRERRHCCPNVAPCGTGSWHLRAHISPGGRTRASQRGHWHCSEVTSSAAQIPQGCCQCLLLFNLKSRGAQSLWVTGPCRADAVARSWGSVQVLFQCRHHYKTMPS